jgi:CIC family chloride channel protein
MGAVFAGVIRAPITSVLIIIEMTRGYALILPLMIANTTAYIIARRFRATSIYESLLEQDGLMPRASTREPREVQPVAALVRGEPALTLRPGMAAELVLERCGRDSGTHIYPVLDSHRQVVGVVTQEEIRILAASPELLPVTTASDLMRPPVTVRHDEDVSVAMEAMLRCGLRELPVVGADGRLVGVVDDKAIVSAYQRRSDTPSLHEEKGSRRAN